MSDDDPQLATTNRKSTRRENKPLCFVDSTKKFCDYLICLFINICIRYCILIVRTLSSSTNGTYLFYTSITVFDEIAVAKCVSKL